MKHTISFRVHLQTDSNQHLQILVDSKTLKREENVFQQ